MALDIVNEIPAGKRAEVRDAIFAYRPNNETDKSTGDPLFTDAEWGDEIVWRFLKRCYKKGRDIIRDREATDLDDIRNP